MIEIYTSGDKYQHTFTVLATVAVNGVVYMSNNNMDALIPNPVSPVMTYT